LLISVNIAIDGLTFGRTNAVERNDFFQGSTCIRGKQLICIVLILVGKPEGKRPLVRPRRRWEDNIRMDLQEVGWGCEDWIGLAQDRDRWRALVSAVMNLRVP
jgi:hypothetical protein